MTDDGLRELVEAARAGDPDAWESLYRRAYPKLLGYAGRRLTGREEAEDAVSETLARAIRLLPRFTWQGAGFEAWLYGICRNVVLETQRAGRFRGFEPVPEVVETAPGPLETVLVDEEAALVRRAFGRLNSADQELLELRVVGGLDADEVGTLIGKRAGAVRMAQSRALERLRSALG